MKKILNYSFALFAGIAFALACSKVDVNSDITEPVTPDQDAKKQVSITVSIQDQGLTRVAFTESDADKSGGMKLSWEVTDKLDINGEEFTIAAGSISADGKTATFEGPDVGAGPYTITYNGGDFENDQIQDKDASTDHLKYYASLVGVNSYQDIAFTDAWAEAHNGTLTQSGILRLRAQMPTTEIAAAVKDVKITAFDADGEPVGLFHGNNQLELTLSNQVDTDEDRILDLYFNLPTWEQDIPANTSILVRFKTDEPHAVFAYTRYHTFTSGLTLNPGEVNAIKLNCTATAQHAGNKSVCDGTTAEKAYLIGDPYQLKAVYDLASETSKTFFKMIDDVDMTGMTDYVPINEGVTNYAQVVDFNGNHKTVSNLGKHLFYVLKGSVYDLSLDACLVDARGILAEFIQGTGNTVTNITVSNGKVNYTGSYDSSKGTGGLIGTINNGSGTAVTITNCKVSNTDVKAEGLVGGVIGYANSVINMSGCEYSGGTVTASNRWCGGMLGSTGDFASTITDCHVMNATVTSSSDRVGGFTGQIGRNGVTVKGCTVGTESQKVTVHSSLSGATVNLGGFAGVCYGTVTKNGEVRNKAFVNITCDNSNAGTTVNIGGFVGYLEKCSIDYSDANATISSIRGHQVGGFAAILTNAGTCTIDNCTASGTVTGNNYVAGFIGLANAADHVITNNTSAGSVSGAATVAGFVGMASQGTWTKNSTSCTVSASGANIGGFAGQLNGIVTVSKCFTTGTVTGSGNVCGGFTAIASNGATINDCYSTSDLGGGTRKRGGLVGYVDAGTVSINRCYTTSNISNNFEMGGLIGFVSVETLTMTKCAAWNGTLVAGSRADNNWSSAACVGVTYLTCTLTDNYRSPEMDLLAYWGTNSGCSINLPNSFQHPNVSSSTPLTDPSGNAVTSSTMRPYQGKCEEGKTLSQLASTTLGWSSDVWDFTGDLPTLK